MRKEKEEQYLSILEKLAADKYWAYSNGYWERTDTNNEFVRSAKKTIDMIEKLPVFLSGLIEKGLASENPELRLFCACIALKNDIFTEKAVSVIDTITEISLVKKRKVLIKEAKILQNIIRENNCSEMYDIIFAEKTKEKSEEELFFEDKENSTIWNDIIPFSYENIDKELCVDLKVLVAFCILDNAINADGFYFALKQNNIELFYSAIEFLQLSKEEKRKTIFEKAIEAFEQDSRSRLNKLDDRYFLLEAKKPSYISIVSYIKERNDVKNKIRRS
jgi:hypothetical protein